MSNQLKSYVLVGRFQPFHNGHLEICIQALSKADQLLIVIGSTNKARDVKNPFTFKERENMILSSLEKVLSEYLNKGIKKSINIVSVDDYPYNNNKWLQQVQEKVLSKILNNSSVFLTGFIKDSSSDYLNYFPQWKSDFVNSYLDNKIDATNIRNEYFSQDYYGKKHDEFIFQVPDKALEFLYKFSKTKNYTNLRNEYDFINKYRSQFENLKYKVPFLTADSIVVCSGHVLLVERKNYPGKGLLAIPGGFVDSATDYDQISCGLRELREETKLKVPEPVLRGSIRKTVDFSDPSRSLRWRIFTKAILIMLADKTLPKVQGSDDAKKAFWMPINDIILNKDKFFEDHYHILTTMLGI